MRVVTVIPLLSLLLACDPSASDDPSERDASMPPLDAGRLLDAAPDADAKLPDAAPPGHDGSSPDAGSPGDAGQKNDAGGANLSILARASEDKYTCSVSRALRNYKPLTWGYQGSSLSANGAATWVARVEATTGSSPFDPGPSTFVVSTVTADGTLGTSRTVPTSDPKRVARPTLVPLDAGAMALFWYEDAEDEQGPKTFRSARYDANGVLTVSPRDLFSEAASYITELHAVRTSGGQFGLLFSASDGSGGTRVKFALLDAAGALLGTPRVLSDKGHAGSALVSDASGFALIYQTLDTARQHSDQLFVRIGPDGQLEGAEKKLNLSSSAPSTAVFGAATIALLRTGDVYLAAWPEGSAGNDDFSNPAGAYRVLRVSRFSADGSVLASAVLRDKTDSIDEEEPVLTTFGDSVALSFGRAKHIYICAGCVPDHSVELVLLNPVTLAPRSNVVRVMNAMAGGLLQKQVAVQGDTLLTTLQITYHVHSDPAFLAFQCVAT